MGDYYVPHSMQQPFHDSKAKTKVAECARRSGKSRMAFGELMMTYEKVLNRVRPATLVPAFHAWIVVPTEAQGRQSWHELLSLVPKGLQQSVSQADKVMYLEGSPNWEGGESAFGMIELKSSFDPETLQSVGLDFLWIQEAQDVSERAFVKVLPSTRSPDRLGLRVYEGIPSLYRDHWFRKAYEQAEREGKSRDMLAYKITYLNNPMLSEEVKREIEEDAELMSHAAWLRMYMAVYSENAGFFTNIEACVSGDLLRGPIDGRFYVAGFDIGLTQDPSEIFIMDRDSRAVVHWQEWDSGVSWPDQRQRLLALHEEWLFQELVFDASALGGVMAEQEFAETVLPATPFKIVGDTRKALLERLKGALERETISFPNIKPLIRQLRAFEARRLRSGIFRVEAPAGEHDDCVFALALALQACADPRPIARGGRAAPRPYFTSLDKPTTAGSRIMRDRRSERLVKRAEKAGVNLR
jgi:hypothetical protein